MYAKTIILSTVLLLAPAVPSFADPDNAPAADAAKVEPAATDLAPVEPADASTAPVAQAAPDTATPVEAAATDALPVEQPAADTAQVEAASAQFYTSLNALFTGDAAPMEAIWSHADDVTYMGPIGGIQVGWDKVGAVWQSQAALKLGGKVEPTDVHVTVSGDLAFVGCYEVGHNVDAQGQSQQVSIRATNQFRKENGEWKMIGHHTDLLPFLEKETQQKSAE